MKTTLIMNIVSFFTLRGVSRFFLIIIVCSNVCYTRILQAFTAMESVADFGSCRHCSKNNEEMQRISDGREP